MPLVDVTDLLFDPDIAGQFFTVIRRREIVNSYGESVWITETIPDLIGSIQPKGDQSLMREDAYDAQAKTIVIATTFRLRGVSQEGNKTNWKPDIILYAGNHFELISPDDWSAFGAGFIEAEATSVVYVDPPPSNTPQWRAQLDFSKPINSVYAHGAGAGAW